MRDYLNLDYTIWRANRFDEDILQDIVAKFSDLELAKSFVEYQTALGNSFKITKGGKIVDLD